MIDRFFKPFFQGIFLSPLKLQSSKQFEFVFKMFTEGYATLPSNGMGEISKQLALSLRSDNIIKYNTKITSISEEGSVYNTKTYLYGLHKGKKIKVKCDQIILAADAPSASSLLDGMESIPEGRGSTCLYFGINGQPPTNEPILILNGDNDISNGYTTNINNVCFPSNVAKAYAPEGKSLASVTLIGSTDGLSESELVSTVRNQLSSWWPDANVNDWTFLKSYR
jgi:phytoene dehydrogenase-like protein